MQITYRIKHGDKKYETENKVSFMLRLWEEVDSMRPAEAAFEPDEKSLTVVFANSKANGEGFPVL